MENGIVRRTLGPPRLLKDPARGDGEGIWGGRMRDDEQKCDKRSRRRRSRGHWIVEHTNYNHWVKEKEREKRRKRKFWSFEDGEIFGDFNGNSLGKPQKNPGLIFHFCFSFFFLSFLSFFFTV